MKTEQMKWLVQEYFDGELAREREPELFSLLAEYEEMRTHFSAMHRVRETVANDAAEFPSELDNRILSSLGSRLMAEKRSFFSRPSFVFASYAVSVVLLLFSLFLYFQSGSITNYDTMRYQQAVEVIEQQNRQIESLLNSYPPITVSDKIPNDYKIIITPKL